MLPTVCSRNIYEHGAEIDYACYLIGYAIDVN